MEHNGYNHSWNTVMQSIANFLLVHFPKYITETRKKLSVVALLFWESGGGGGGAYLSVVLICLFQLHYRRRLLLRKGFLLECELCFPEGIMVLVLSVLSDLC